MYRKLWMKITILFLLTATFLGAFLRYLQFSYIEGINFKNLLHAHSHVAFMGWIFNALFIGLVYSFIPKDFEGAKKYHKLFLAFQVSVLGMLVTFPIQGYGAASIAFSTLHIVFSVVLAVFFVRDQKKIFKGPKPLSLWFALAGIGFLLLSSFGPFALGYIMATKMAGPFNQLAIYFYLHFQYDGWFTFAVFALFYCMLEKEKIAFANKPARIFFFLMLLSCIPAYAESTLWTQPPLWVYGTAVAAALAQLTGLGYFIASVKKVLPQIKAALSGWAWFLLLFAFACFAFKTVVQLFGTIPFVADLTHTYRAFLLFYLHTIFLGFVSVFLFAWFSKYNLYTLRPLQGKVFLAGFVVSQLLIVAQPLLVLLFRYVIPDYQLILFAVSLLMPLAFLFNEVPVLYRRKDSEGLLLKSS